MFKRFSQLLLQAVLISLFSGKVFSTSIKTNGPIHIPYGKNSEIIFDTHTGTYSVFYGKRKIISDAYSLVKNNGQSLGSRDYKKIRSEQNSITDEFGKGTKYTIVMTGTGMPQMAQVFYVYAGHDYFFTEVSLKGAGLKTNYMAPLIATTVNLCAKGDNRTLFVPFDNDTFIRYNALSMEAETENTSSEVGAYYENNSRNGLIAGSVEHQVWKTGVLTSGRSDQLNKLCVWGGYSEEKTTRDKISHGSISGSSVKSPKVFIGYFSDWRNGMEAYGKANKVQEKPYVFNWNKPTPFGWNSWGVIQEKLTYEKATRVVDFFADELPQFRNGNTAYIDLDSFWDNFTGGMKGDYSKLKQFADYCKSKGLEPGVYWAPFTDWGWKSSSDREAEGSHYKFSEMWTKVNGAYHDFDGRQGTGPYPSWNQTSNRLHYR
jgi:alpha-galactosidase